MKLRVFAARDILVPLRDVDGTALQPQMGGLRRYVGRDLVAAMTPPASQEAHEVDTDTAQGEADYLVREVNRGDLFAADEASAKFCGVDFVAVEFKDGAFDVKPGAPAKAPTKPAAPKKDGE